MEQNKPTGGSWTDDWKAAEAKAAAFEEKTNAKKPTDARTDQDGAQDPQAGGGQSELQGAPADEPEQDGEPQGSSEGDGQGDSDDGDGEASQQGGPEQLARAERIARLKADAKELGWEVEAGAVTVADRVAFREEKRNFRQKLQAEADEARQFLMQEGRKHYDLLARAQKIAEGIENNDLDAVAQAIGRKSWNDLSDEAYRRQLSPEHKELIELRRARAEEEQRRKEQEAQVQAREREQATVAQRQKYQAELARQVGGLKDKTLAAFADDPMFIQNVMYYQEQEWDGEETIPVAEAAKRALADVQAVHAKLSKRLGVRAAQEPEVDVPTSGANAEQQRRKSPKNVSQREASDASATANGAFDEQAWTKKWATQLKNSQPDS